MNKIAQVVLTSMLAFVCIFGVANAYTVVQGDTMWEIAQNAGISLNKLISFNPQIDNPDLIEIGEEISTANDLMGGTLPVAGQTYTLAGSGVASAETSITLSSLTISQTGYELLDADFSSTFYVTLEPGSTRRQEIVSCTTVTQNSDDTATLSGCSRGLQPFSPFTASSTYRFAHAGGTSLIFSDPPQLFNEYTAKGNDESIAGTWTFYDFPVFATSTQLPDANAEFATKYYVDQVGAGGFTAANASTTQGILVNGTSPETIGVNVSSTMGMYGGADEQGIYQTVSSTLGLGQDSNGIYIKEGNYINFDSSGNIEVDATSTPTASKVVLGTVSTTLQDGWLGADTAGDLVYSDGANMTNLGIGSSGQILQTNSGATAPEWVVGNFELLGGVGANSGRDYWNYNMWFDTVMSNWVRSDNAFTVNEAYNRLDISFPADNNHSMLTIQSLGMRDNGDALNFSSQSVIVEFDIVLNNLANPEQLGWGLSEGTAPFFDFDDQTDDSVCFTMDTSGALYAHTANAAVGHTETLISGVTLSQTRNTYRIEWDPGIDAKFYVNETLKATVTSTLPDSGAVKFGLGGTGNGSRIDHITAPWVAVEK